MHLYFVDSLDDPALRFRVLERDPITLEEALKVASRLEALGSREGEENWDDWGRRRNRLTKIAAAEDDDDDRQHLTRHSNLGRGQGPATVAIRSPTVVGDLSFTADFFVS